MLPESKVHAAHCSVEKTGRQKLVKKTYLLKDSLEENRGGFLVSSWDWRERSGDPVRCVEDPNVTQLLTIR
jgi:hypothetical protein